MFEAILYMDKSDASKKVYLSSFLKRNITEHVRN